MLLTSMLCWAQQGGKYMYWIDSDFGNRKTGTYSQSIILPDIDTEEQSHGVHLLYVMLQDSTGAWSAPQRFAYFLQKMDLTELKGQQVTEMEWWFDDQYDRRSEDKITSDGLSTKSIDISALTPGSHLFNYRLKNDAGQYGLIYTSIFYILPVQPDESAPVQRIEYWIDEDFAHRQSANLNGGISTSFELDTDTLDGGVHMLYARPQNTKGDYGPLNRYIFYKPQTLPQDQGGQLKGYEYWIDNDYAGRKYVSASNLNSFTVPVSQLSSGLHQFYFRAIDSQNRWGVLFSSIFYMMPLEDATVQPITGYRYFLNSKMVEKNTTSSTSITNTLSFSIPDILTIASVSDTCHFAFDAENNQVELQRNTPCYFAMQFRNKAGDWSAPMDTTFCLTDSLTREMQTLQMDGVVYYDRMPQGDFGAFRFTISNDRYVYFSSSAPCSMLIYDAEGNYVGGASFDGSYSEYLDAGTYYGILYNTTGEADNVSLMMMQTSGATAKPSISYHPASQYVKISCAEMPEADIYYTLDETDPVPYVTENCFAYVDSFRIEHNLTVKAIAKYGTYNPSNPVLYKINSFQVAVPTCEYKDLKLYLACATEGATIRYTLDGRDPVTEGTVYTDPVHVTSNCVVKAVATKENWNNSPLLVKELNMGGYIVTQPTITRTENGTTVQIVCATEGSTIYYTLDGSTPSATNGKPYDSDQGVEVTENCTIQAVAVKDGMIQSGVTSFEVDWFKVEPVKAEMRNLTVFLSCSTEHAEIYYTTDPDQEPLAKGTRYDAATGIPFTETMHLLAAARRTDKNWNDSEVLDTVFVKADYTCQKPKLERSGNTLVVTSGSGDSAEQFYYTTDGTVPTTSSTKYEAPIELTGNLTYQVIAAKPGKFNSEVAVYEENGFKVAKPTAEVKNLKIVLGCATPDSRIYYTTNGDDPDKEGEIYTDSNPLPFNKSIINVRAIAKKDNYEKSDTINRIFNKVDYTCKTPVFNIGDDKMMTIRCGTAGATIYYTIDGETPDQVYTEPVQLQKNGRISAIAKKDGELFDSEMAEITVSDFVVAAPVAVPDPTNKVLRWTCATPGAKLYYTIGGQTPTTADREYSEVNGIKLTDNRIVKVLAVAEGFNATTSEYELDWFACDSIKLHYDGRWLSLSCSTPDASIHYTLDGSMPDDHSPRFDGTSIDVGADCQEVRAVALKDYWTAYRLEPYDVPAYYDGAITYVHKAGQIEQAYGWCDKESMEQLTVKGSINASDLAVIKAMPQVRDLDLKDAAIEEMSLPDEAFAGMKLRLFVGPKVTRVGAAILKDVQTIGAIEWNANIAMPDDILGGVEHPNMLVYAQLESDVNRNLFRNLIVQGEAKEITLSDAEDRGNFYCHKEFRARKIGYKHTYTLPTAIGICQGWEALSLPFDVQEIVHPVRKECLPFAAWEEGSGYRPFWLSSLESGGFEAAKQITAYTPFIISMPNSEDYSDEWILSGEISFKASDVTIRPMTDENLVVKAYRGRLFVPNCAYVSKADTILTLNIEEDYQGHPKGSVFVRDHRDARPFEAYITADQELVSKAPYFAIDDVSTGINDLTIVFGREVYVENGVLYINSSCDGSVNLYNTAGHLVRVLQLHRGLNEVSGLSRGVYVVKGHKVIID